MHYMHKMWSEDNVLSPIEHVLHVKHEMTACKGNAYMVVRGTVESHSGSEEEQEEKERKEEQRNEKEEEEELYSAGGADMADKKDELLAKAANITPSMQMERFLYLLAEDHRSWLGEVSDNEEHIQQKPEKKSKQSSAALDLGDGVDIARYRRLVYEPATAYKIFYPAFRKWDDAFLGLVRLLQTTDSFYQKALDARLLKLPTSWTIVFVCLCYRLIGREDFFVNHFDGRLALPHLRDINALKQVIQRLPHFRDINALKQVMQRMLGQGVPVFTDRYQNQGIERTVNVLKQVLDQERYPLEFQSTENVQPLRRLFEWLKGLQGVNAFIAWQVSIFLYIYVQFNFFFYYYCFVNPVKTRY